MIKLLVLHIVLIIIFTTHVITCQLFYINSKRILSFYCDNKYIILRHLKHVYGIASCDNCFIKKNNEGLLSKHSYTLISFYVQLRILGDPCRVKNHLLKLYCYITKRQSFVQRVTHTCVRSHTNKLSVN